ncbi:hypothetical protein KBB85_06160 [Patescibacteria group bacterium]|nr:hypothetical protein [Patescibacteria group bacterium]
MESETAFLPKAEKADFEGSRETKDIESKLVEIVPIDELIKIFGEDTYLIGGAVRDTILDKTVSDLDLMTRTPLSEVLESLKDHGFTENDGTKFSEGGFSVKKGVDVINMLLHGREIQVASIGDTAVEDLVATADINLNCCAFSLASRSIVNQDYFRTIQDRELSFCDEKSAASDPMKIVSALKQISRLPELHVSEETMQIIRKAMPMVGEYFRVNPDRRHKLKPLFGNINSSEVEDLFRDHGLEDVLDGISFKKEKLAVSGSYFVVAVEDIEPEIKDKIRVLITKHYGRRLDPTKVFNTKINSVAYELDQNSQVIACCLLDGERIYAVASSSADSIVKLVANLCEENYNVWATISTTSQRVIDLSVRAGLKLVNDPEIVKKVLVGNYPEYSGRLVLEKKADYMTFSKSDSEDPPQVLLIS